METLITTKQRTLSIVCVILFLLACNLAPATTRPSTPTASAVILPIDTPTPAMILSPDATPTMDTPLTEAAVAANQCAAVPAGMVGWWPGNGDAQDVVAGHDGKLNGGAGFAAGKVGQAFSFNGRGSVDVSLRGELDVRKQVTIEFWMKPDPDNAMDRCCQGLVGTEYFLVQISRGWPKGTGINFAIHNGNLLKQTSDEKDTAVQVSAGEWSFIVGTYDGQSLRLYVNGQEAQSLDHPGKIAPMFIDSFLTVGSEDGRTDCDNCDGRHYFKGLIDEVSMYNRALTPDEIQSIFSADEAGKCVSSP